MIGKYHGMPVYEQHVRKIELHQTLQHTLPQVLLSLVGDYSLDMSPAIVAMPLETDKQGKPIDSDVNRIIVKQIAVALTLSDFDPSAKERIFLHACDKEYHAVINTIMDSIRMRGEKIYLDHIYFNGYDLMEFNFSGVSAVNCRFKFCSFLNLEKADLTKAKISYSSMIGAQLSGAILDGTKLMHTFIHDTNFDGAIFSDTSMESVSIKTVSVLGARLPKVKFKDVTVTGVKTDETEFELFLKSHDSQLSDCEYTSPKKCSIKLE